MNCHWKCRNSIVFTGKHHLRPLMINFELALHVMTVLVYKCQWHSSFSTTNALVLWFGTHACNDISFVEGLSGWHKNMSYSCNHSLILSRENWFFYWQRYGDYILVGKGRNQSLVDYICREELSETTNFLDIYCLLQSPPSNHNADSDDATILYMLWTTQNNFSTYFSSLLCRAK